MSGAPHPDRTDSAVLDQVGPALSRLRRRTLDGRRDLGRNLLLNVIADAARPMTVGGVAEEMGVTQPVASRTVAACIADGLLRRVASQADGRQSFLRLTDSGEAERLRFAAEQRHVFEEITAGWEPADRMRFARYLVRYGQDSRDWSTGRRRNGAGDTGS
jgi:DNA-binding MarR family transcriptional regulator